MRRVTSGALLAAIAASNACAKSGLILLIAICQTFRMHAPSKSRRYRKTAHQFHPLTFI